MTDSSPAANKALIQDYFAAWDSGDPSEIQSFFAADFATTYTDWLGNEITVNPADVHDWIAGWLDTIEEMTHEIHTIVAEDNHVMAHITYRGVHDGAIYDIPPTGNQVEVTEFLHFQVENDEIIELDWLSDDLTLIQQLGVDLPINQG